MKLWAIALSLLMTVGSVRADTEVWQPAAGHTQIPLWPGTPPDAKPIEASGAHSPPGTASAPPSTLQPAAAANPTPKQ